MLGSCAQRPGFNVQNSKNKTGSTAGATTRGERPAGGFALWIRGKGRERKHAYSMHLVSFADTVEKIRQIKMHF